MFSLLTICLLDGAGAGIIIIFPLLFFALLLVWALVEGFIINLFGINTFLACFKQAITVNLASLVAGFILMSFTYWWNADPENIPYWVTNFFASVLIEGILLKVINRSKEWLLIFKASFVMNLLTYIILYAFALYFL
jgi:hypothetical protein